MFLLRMKEPEFSIETNWHTLKETSQKYKNKSRYDSFNSAK